MDTPSLEELVNDLFERSDARIFEIFHRIADLALEQSIEKGTLAESPDPK